MSREIRMLQKTIKKIKIIETSDGGAVVAEG